jgi:monothiol glutaredoxin
MLSRTLRHLARRPAFPARASRPLCTHDDFKPQRKAPELDDAAAAKNFIAEATRDNRVMLFMKGTPQQPQCGFSAQVVRILHAEGQEFASANVLEDAALREGIKEYSNWPTIPQVYIDGEFVGGCDILTQLYQSGELEEMLGESK